MALYGAARYHERGQELIRLLHTCNKGKQLGCAFAAQLPCADIHRGKRRGYKGAAFRIVIAHDGSVLGNAYIKFAKSLYRPYCHIVAQGKYCSAAAAGGKTVFYERAGVLKGGRDLKYFGVLPAYAVFVKAAHKAFAAVCKGGNYVRAADYNKIPFALFKHMPTGHISAQKIVAAGKGLAAARKAAGKEHKGQLSGAHKLYSGQTVAGGKEYNAVRTVTQRGVYCVQLVFGLFAAVEKKSGAAVLLADGFYSAVKAAVYRVADIGIITPMLSVFRARRALAGMFF